MSRQASFPRECFAAHLAWKPLRLNASDEQHVRSHVLLVASPIGERAAADGAQKRSLAGMYTPVPIETVLPPEPLAAVRALELFLGVVKSRVGGQVTGSFEGLAAHLALVWTVVRVHLDMLVQMTAVRKHFVAYQARELG